jgi:hypothetical protein
MGYRIVVLGGDGHFGGLLRCGIMNVGSSCLFKQG